MLDRLAEPAQAERADGLEVLDALLGRAHGRLAAAEQPLRVGGAVLRQPAVVGVEAGLLEVEVPVVADGHTNGGIEDLRCHPVALLIGHARVGVPAAPVEVFELHPRQAQLLRRLAGRGHEAHRDRYLQTLHMEDVARLARVLQHRRLRLPLRVDVVDVGMGRLRDVGIRRDDRIARAHRDSLSRLRTPTTPPRVGAHSGRAGRWGSPSRESRRAGLPPARG